ncbi:MAG: zinc-ribbon domain-containing protein, partial [Rhodocyclaceae bacterium]|nr:zinc-ribbon domain-containing protein [Rhodocyclaceae bacterium]
MMLTRCPACQTAFRVRPEQLRLRQGRVRCGSCGKAFNALATLFDEAQAQADDAAAIPDPQHDQGAVQQMIDEQVLAPHAEAETEAEA